LAALRVIGGTLVGLALASAWGIGLLGVLDEYWPAPRVLAHHGVFWAGVMLLAYHLAGRWLAWLVTTLGVLVAVSFVGSNAHVLHDQHRLNRRDAAKANRIVARLEELPGYSQVATVAVHGVQWAYPVALETVDHDLNISAFGASWAQPAILAEISGAAWGSGAADPAATAAAASYCAGVEPWPGPAAVAIRGTLAIVCVGR
jgi:hypothetical protein